MSDLVNGAILDNSPSLVEHDLLWAVLKRAIYDVSMPEALTKQEQSELAQWFESNSMAPFSFLWITTELGILPEKIRDKLVDFTTALRQKRLAYPKRGPMPEELKKRRSEGFRKRTSKGIHLTN